jgi:hypothetical protein
MTTMYTRCESAGSEAEERASIREFLRKANKRRFEKIKPETLEACYHCPVEDLKYHIKETPILT